MNAAFDVESHHVAVDGVSLDEVGGPLPGDRAISGKLHEPELMEDNDGAVLIQPKELADRHSELLGINDRAVVGLDSRGFAAMDGDDGARAPV